MWYYGVVNKLDRKSKAKNFNTVRICCQQEDGMKKHDSENNDVQKNRASCPESMASESYEKDLDAVSQNHTGIHIEGSVIIV